MFNAMLFLHIALWVTAIGASLFSMLSFACWVWYNFTRMGKLKKLMYNLKGLELSFRFWPVIVAVFAWIGLYCFS